MAIRIVVVDDHTVVRQGLRVMLSATAGFEVVGEAGDGRAALQTVRRCQPDVVLMDVALPRLGGAEAAEKIAQELPGVRILALSGHQGLGYADTMRRAGAHGFLSKVGPVNELIDAIRAVAAGGEVFPRRSRRDSVAIDQLSQRERQVLVLLADGKTSAAIAKRLRLSVKTIESHRHKLMRKLGITGVAGLTKYAVQAGLSAPDP